MAIAASWCRFDRRLERDQTAAEVSSGEPNLIKYKAVFWTMLRRCHLGFSVDWKAVVDGVGALDSFRWGAQMNHEQLLGLAV